jgi:hypothetical protein
MHVQNLALVTRVQALLLKLILDSHMLFISCTLPTDGNKNVVYALAVTCHFYLIENLLPPTWYM